MVMIAESLTGVREKIKKAAEKSGRNAGDIKLICVTKGRSLEETKEAIGAGVVDIGENKVQETVLKYNSLKLMTYDLKLIKWHMIGHLQTNKAADAVKIFDLIHSVDSLKLATEISAQAAKVDKIQDILVEVNTSGEKQKFGVNPDGLTELVKAIMSLKNIKVSGLMTMAPLVKNQEEARPYFRKLRQLQSEVNNLLITDYKLPITVLSMGMSQDYEVAVEEGATMVRIGTAIFEG